MKQKIKKYPLYSSVGAIIALSLIYFISTGDHSSEKHTFSVEIAKVSIQEMPVLIQAPGVVLADRTVTIEPQVSGVVVNIAFNEGQDVKEGQLLFELDPSPFVQSLDQAMATLWRDEATLEQNLRDAKRSEALAKKEYVTIQQAEQARTIAKAQQAIVNADIAAVRKAEIQLSYTKICSPIAGKTGNIVPHLGTLVTANASPLVVVNGLDPVLVNFNLTQSQLKNLLYYQKKGSLVVQVMYESDAKVLMDGYLVFTDNSVNIQTGTVLLKARVPNKEYLLWPGMMVSVNLILTVEKNAIVVPIEAIKMDQKGHYLYAVEEGKAIIKRLEVNREIEGLAVISQGLSGKEMVILTIPPDLTEGDLVQVSAEGAIGSHL